MKEQLEIIIKAKFYTFMLLSCFIVKATNENCEKLKNEYDNALKILNTFSKGKSPERSLKLCAVVEAIQKYKTDCPEASEIDETYYFDSWKNQTEELRDECYCPNDAWHCSETIKGLECGIGNKRRKIDPPNPVYAVECDD